MDELIPVGGGDDDDSADEQGTREAAKALA
jgi:hypothetical protein